VHCVIIKYLYVGAQRLQTKCHHFLHRQINNYLTSSRLIVCWGEHEVPLFLPIIASWA